jgi:hypothetical protein
MIRRWIIRCSFLLPLLLCAGAWMASYHYLVSVGFVRPRTSLGLDVLQGKVIFSSTDAFGRTQGWNTGAIAISAEDEFPTEPLGRQAFWGFFASDNAAVAGSSGSVGTHWAFVGIPFWFPTTIFALALIIVWRKTRPKINPVSTFPVKIAQLEASDIGPP